MNGVVLAVAGAAALAVVHAVTPALHRLPRRHQAALSSLSGGAGLAYVCVYLLFELARDGAPKIHAFAPIGPDPLETLFLLILGGLSGAYVVQVHLEKTADLHDDHRGYAVFFLTYGVLVGVGLLEEARWGALNLAFYVAALGLHLLSNDLFLQHLSPRSHTRRWRLALALGPLVGCVLAASIAVPYGLQYGMIALVAGGTIINVVRRELPDVQSFRPLAFMVGVFVYTGLIFATWRF